MRRRRFFNADMDLPTNGFLGFEDFGVYQEKPVTAKQVSATDEAPPEGENIENKNEEERS